MDVAVLFLVMAVCLAIGVPIGVSLALSMFALLLVNPVTTTTFITQSMYSGVASFTMLALPFFCRRRKKEKHRTHRVRVFGGDSWARTNDLSRVRRTL